MKVKLKTIFYLIVFLIIENGVFGQEKKSWNHDIGINLLQIPATTIDLVYEFSNNPRYTIIVNSGYTINYAKSFDIIGFFLSPHYKCGNYGYSIENRSGGFIKAGMKFNLRRKIEKKSYFYLGAFLTNSLIHEEAEYRNMEDFDSQAEYLKHEVFVFGLTCAMGYHFRISKKLSSDFGVHISIASNSYDDLYGYTNYIPGMGYMEMCRVFPMLVLNLKYKLK